MHGIGQRGLTPWTADLTPPFQRMSDNPRQFAFEQSTVTPYQSMGTMPPAQAAVPTLVRYTVS